MTTTNAATPATEHTLKEVTAQRDQLLAALIECERLISDNHPVSRARLLAVKAIARARNVNPTTP